ncbi:hypothetical protein P691DRAFT_812194 [Macrolepiota fuliginosa MF-IS2]|uniref:Uncharacterized protein n=1 Tax=Macrolepiota fuliginosa MF-IS2 TaxID=1400762 RepID=A0A9P5WZE6_9AGAR|nr:hypothetical protein P691DRAFT_812194 [Macrolepiota fuliginosa MF-IS2]
MKTLALTRRRPPLSEQPSVPKLLELGVKVRDFAYESTLPPIPTVYLQPRQIQPSEPKDVNDPNDPHYILEEERKKKVYTLESTRKIERTPTEPALETELQPPPRRTFPKIKRTDAQANLASQPNDQYHSQSQPPLPHALPHDITNTTPQYSQLQPVPGLTVDSQEPWIDTPIITPNGSPQFPNIPRVAVHAASTSPITSQSGLGSDSQQQRQQQAPGVPDEEPMSYSQMGFSQPLESSQPLSLLPLSTSTSQPLIGGTRLETHGLDVDVDVDMVDVAPATCARRDGGCDLALGPSNPHQGAVERERGRVESVLTPSSTSSRALTPPTEPMQSPPTPPHQILGSSSPAPIASTSTLSQPTPIPSTSSPRYNLRHNKRRRRTESPLPTKTISADPVHHPSSRLRSSKSKPKPKPKSTRGAVQSTPITSAKTGAGVSAKSVHTQNKALPGAVSTGRTLKRSRGGEGGREEEGREGDEGETSVRRSKRRHAGTGLAS